MYREGYKDPGPGLQKAVLCYTGAFRPLRNLVIRLGASGSMSCCIRIVLSGSVAPVARNKANRPFRPQNFSQQ